MFKSISEIVTFKEAGISTDMNVFFKDDLNVSYFKISSDDEKYFIDVTLIENSNDNIEDIFYSFVKYIKYSHVVCYQKNIKDNCVIYEFITANDKMRGFCCYISFKLD